MSIGERHFSVSTLSQYQHCTAFALFVFVWEAVRDRPKWSLRWGCDLVQKSKHRQVAVVPHTGQWQEEAEHRR